MTAATPLRRAVKRASRQVIHLATAAATSALGVVLPASLVLVALSSCLSSLASCTATTLTAGYLSNQGESSSIYGGERLASVALAEFTAGEAGDTYHKDDGTYWEEIAGSTFVGSADGETPWCAAFVSWCARKAGFTQASGDDGAALIPESTFTGDFIDYYESNLGLGTVFRNGSAYEPRAGDIVCYGTEHIGIVVQTDGQAFSTVEGNTSSPAGPGSVGRHEYSGPWSTWKGDDAVYLRPNYPPVSAIGEIEIPETCDYVYESAKWPWLSGTWRGLRVGWTASRECEPLSSSISWDTGSECYKVQLAWQRKGAKHDALGFPTIDGKYMIACTQTFGQVGDEVVFYFDNGYELDCIITDTKDQTETYGAWPANEWGHPLVSGSDDTAAGTHPTEIGVLEFFGGPEIGDSPYQTLGLSGHRVVSASNKGRYAGL